jgi:UDP:flavonoid glycosyltransferase YjiC (YdhE family)
MRMSLIADGTRGDVQPFLGLAHALRRRDHAVQLVTNASHARFVDPLVAEGVIASAVYFPVDWADVFAGDEAVVAALAKGDELAYMRALMDVWTRSAGVVAPVAL